MKLPDELREISEAKKKRRKKKKLEGSWTKIEALLRSYGMGKKVQRRLASTA